MAAIDSTKLWQGSGAHQIKKTSNTITNLAKKCCIKNNDLKTKTVKAFLMLATSTCNFSQNNRNKCGTKTALFKNISCHYRHTYIWQVNS